MQRLLSTFLSQQAGIRAAWWQRRKGALARKSGSTRGLLTLMHLRVATLSFFFFRAAENAVAVVLLQVRPCINIKTSLMAYFVQTSS
jgi:hypothetical protein